MIKILDFYADWCQPCKTMAPILHDVVNELDCVTLEKINIEEDVDSAEEYDIRSIPTLIFFKDNKQIDRVVGAMSKDRLRLLINKHCNNN